MRQSKTFEQIAYEIEGPPREHRWTARGADTMAIVLGFARPSDSDDEGMWMHPTLGSYPDSKMQLIVKALLEKWAAWSETTDLDLTLNNVLLKLQECFMLITHSLRVDGTANKDAVVAAGRVCKHIRRAGTVCEQVTFGGEANSEQD